VFKKKKNKPGIIQLKQCRYKGINPDGRYVVECDVSIDDNRIPYKNTKAILLIGKKITGEGVEVVME